MRIQTVVCFFLLGLIMSGVLMPHMAQARAGSGSSMGSRGSRTYSAPAPSAAPITRTATAPSTTPASSTATPGLTPTTPMGSHPFLSGLAGGFLGAGLGSMLFGHGFMGGMGGGGGLLPILLLLGGGYFLYRMLKGRGMSAPSPMGGYVPVAGASSVAPADARALDVTEADQSAFEQLLTQIQTCWSEGNITRLRQYTTPEMVQYFSEQLAANASKVLANMVLQVHLEQGDVIESWSEYGMDYATVQMRWSALDYMVRLDRKAADADYIATGSDTAPVEAEEYWTFARAQGGKWLLSAIQQMQ